MSPNLILHHQMGEDKFGEDVLNFENCFEERTPYEGGGIMF